MRSAAAVLKRRRAEFAALMTDEMGKTVTDGLAEVDKCATACEHFADQAASYLARVPVAIDGAEAFVTFNPLGVVLAVMPWNFPFWQVFRFAAPTLMAGNGAVLKHASNVPGCALAIESVFRDAGFPDDLFRTLLVKSDAVDGLIAHPEGRRRHADRQRRRRPQRRTDSRRPAEEVRARARRLRRLRRARRCRCRRGREGLRTRPAW